MSDPVQYQNKKPEGIRLSDAASLHVLSYLKQQADCRGLRISVKKTGCSGLSYVLDYVHSPNADDLVTPLSKDYLLCIDKASYPFVQGMQIDYVRQGLNYKFVFDNPNKTGECGCGESFTVKQNEE